MGQATNQRKFGLIQAENRSYGFRRNLLGLKPIGMAIAGVSRIVDVALRQLRQLRLGDDPVRSSAALVLAAGLVGYVIFWARVVTDRFVEDASLCYTDRLFEACDALKAPKMKKASRV